MGEYISVEPDTGGRTKVITFIDRLTAQAFFYGGKDIPGVGPLALSWVPNPPVVHIKDEDTVVMENVTKHPNIKQIKEEEGGGEEGEILPDRNVERDEMNDSGEEYEWIT